MQKTHIRHNDTLRFGEMPLPDIVGRSLALSLSGDARHAVLILDACGIIRFAATGNLFGWSDDDLTAAPIGLFIPELPLAAETPGYNIAYLRLNVADQGWRSMQAIAGDQRRFFVDVSARLLPIGRSYAMLVAIRERSDTDFGVVL